MNNLKSIQEELVFSGGTVQVFFNYSFKEIKKVVGGHEIIFITDENIYRHHAALFGDEKIIILPAGESTKQQPTVDLIVQRLIDLEADRNTFIVGVGGGVITDLVGYAASVYMRGVCFGLVPTSILAMVDAAVGGKNGVDVGPYKNLVGTITQPQFLWYDFELLRTLSKEEWISGFAEIIKHACIKNAVLFDYLNKNTIEDFQNSLEKISELVIDNVHIKYGVVSSDEHEQGDRKLLNFGHTLGHAIENLNGLLHGYAISIGMVIACKISEFISGFSSGETKQVISLLSRYHLPVQDSIDLDAAWNILLKDKKRSGEFLHFVALEKIGQGVTRKISLVDLRNYLEKIKVEETTQS